MFFFVTFVIFVVIPEILFRGLVRLRSSILILFVFRGSSIPGFRVIF